MLRHKGKEAVVVVHDCDGHFGCSGTGYYWIADGAIHGPFDSEREAALDFHGQFPTADIPWCDFCYREFGGYRFGEYLGDDGE